MLVSMLHGVVPIYIGYTIYQKSLIIHFQLLPQELLMTDQNEIFFCIET
jgi:hypothetical protein